MELKNKKFDLKHQTHVQCVKKREREKQKANSRKAQLYRKKNEMVIYYSKQIVQSQFVY